MALDFSYPDAGDLAYEVFAYIFGDGWTHIASQGTDALSGPFVLMLEYMNSALLTVCAAYCLLGVATGIVGTASDGSAGGRNHNLTWWPLRSVLGISLTAPIVNGASGIQVLILSLVALSSGFSNMIFDTQLERLTQSSYSYRAAIPNPSIRREALDVTESLTTAIFTQLYYEKFQTELLESMKSYGQSNAFPIKKAATPLDGAYSSSIFGDGEYIFKYNFPNSAGVFAEQLGKITISGPSEKDPMVAAKIAAIRQMAELIKPQIYNMLHNKDASPTFASEAIQIYNNAFLNVQQNFASLYPKSSVTQRAEKMTEYAKTSGWMSAGGFPFLMSQLAKEANEKLQVPVKVSKANLDALSLAFNDKNYSDYNIQLSKVIKKVAQQPSPYNSKRTVAESGSVIEDTFYELGWAENLMIERLGQEDPILLIADIGHLFIDGGMALWTAGLTLSTTSGAGKSIANSLSWIPVVGTLSEAMAGGIKGFSKWILMSLRILFSGFFVVGITFAYIFPLLPLIYWVIAIVRYILLIVETVVAAPFWMAAHVWSPANSGLAGERGQHGYFLLLEILIRPPLYVLGFFAVFYSSKAIGWFVSELYQAFSYSYDQVNPGVVGGWSPVGSVIMLVILGFLFMYMYRYLCTEGYSNLPSNVMRWIGQQPGHEGIGNSGKDAHRSSRAAIAVLASSSTKTPALKLPSGNNTSSESTEKPEKAKGTGGSGASIH